MVVAPSGQALRDYSEWNFPTSCNGHGAGMKIKPLLSLTTKIFVQPLSCLFLRHNLSGLIEYFSFFSPCTVSLTPLSLPSNNIFGVFTIIHTPFQILPSISKVPGLGHHVQLHSYSLGKSTRPWCGDVCARRKGCLFLVDS